MKIDPIFITESMHFRPPRRPPPRNTGVVASQTRLDVSHGNLCRRPVVSVFRLLSPSPPSFILFVVLVTADWSLQRFVATLMHWDSLFGIWNRLNSILLNNTQNREKSNLFLFIENPSVFKNPPGFWENSGFFEQNPQINAKAPTFYEKTARIFEMSSFQLKKERFI